MMTMNIAPPNPTGAAGLLSAPPLTTAAAHTLPGLTVLERGWLSSNNIVLHGREDEGAWLIDTGHVTHAAQTLALVQHSLQGQPLRAVANTHLHSDHCGGNASLQQAYGCPLHIPPGGFAAAAAWDEDRMSYRSTGQMCERFVPQAQLLPGATLTVGDRDWQVLAAPGHDPDSVVLFDAHDGVLISADTLWQNGFGVVFPELDGEQAFEVVGQVLDLIEALQPRTVIPGHGTVFTDVADALQRARRRLAKFQAHPERHAHHAMKVLLKYHLMEVQAQAWPALQRWIQTTPLCAQVWQRLQRPQGTLQAWTTGLVAELVKAGALADRDGVVHNV
jgi:glyoxylase-like metal-dependent hydrolase (beta-lactamase superfamily II)